MVLNKKFRSSIGRWAAEGGQMLGKKSGWVSVEKKLPAQYYQHEWQTQSHPPPPRPDQWRIHFLPWGLDGWWHGHGDSWEQKQLARIYFGPVSPDIFLTWKVMPRLGSIWGKRPCSVSLVKSSPPGASCRTRWIRVGISTTWIFWWWLHL